jgi:UDPglucose 6-dehydrogenase
MKISVFGTGYVGLVTGACLADAGNHVVCVDIDPRKVAMLARGELPIHEPGLDAVVKRNSEAGRLRFTTDAKEGVKHGLFQFIAVGTPPDEDGSADLQYVLAVARTIGEHMTEYKVVITKSTVPVSTADKVRAALREALDKRTGLAGVGALRPGVGGAAPSVSGGAGTRSAAATIEYDIVSNPEFLKEGAAVDDFMRPDRVVIGTDSARATELLRALYEPFTRNHERMIVMDIRSAELTKYAANAMLATKISFMNELANLAERFGADIEAVRRGIGSDPRIGYAFIYPGVGFGGSCFPKDVQALRRSAAEVGYEADILAAVEAVNARQKQFLFKKMQAHFGDLRGKVIALWGLAFKPNTDDMREAPSRVLMEALWAAGAKVRAYDPVAMPECLRLYGKRADLVLCRTSQEALQGADALAIVTEWREFRSPDFDAMKQALRAPVIFDGRNLYDPLHMTQAGFSYYAVGRGKA